MNKLSDPNGIRTEQQAKEQIKRCTMKEIMAIDVIKADLASRFPNHQFEIKFNGVSATGDYIKENKTIEEFLQPDWTIYQNGKPIEVEVLVNSEKFGITSIKAVKLRHCIKIQARIAIVRETYCIMLAPDALALIMNRFQPQRVNSIMGGKEVFIITDTMIDMMNKLGFVQKWEYMPAAARIMEQLKGKIFSSNKQEREDQQAIGSLHQTNGESLHQTNGEEF